MVAGTRKFPVPNTIALHRIVRSTVHGSAGVPPTTGALPGSGARSDGYEIRRAAIARAPATSSPS